MSREDGRCDQCGTLTHADEKLIAETDRTGPQQRRVWVCADCVDTVRQRTRSASSPWRVAPQSWATCVEQAVMIYDIEELLQQLADERAEHLADERADRQADWDAECKLRGVDPADVPLDDWDALRRAEVRAEKRADEGEL